MFRNQTRQFSAVRILTAAGKKTPKQGFSRNKTLNSKSAAKKVSGSFHKRWRAVVSTSGFNKTATAAALPEFTHKHIKNEVASYTETQLKGLYRLGAFKPDQMNELFQRPISLVRDESTKKLFQQIDSAKNKKFIITGEPGVGKSTLLAQALALGIDKKALIIHLSHPDRFLNGTNDYYYDGKQYVQPMYLRDLLKKTFHLNNAETLKSIPLSKEYKFKTNNADGGVKSITLSSKENTLMDLLNFTAAPRSRAAHFGAVIHEISTQSLFPVFFTVDNFSRILTTPFTAYKNVENKNIHLLEFQLGKFIMDVVSGAVKFRHSGSCVLLATSGIDRTNRTLPIGLGKLPHDHYLTRYHYEPIFAELMQKGGVQEFKVEKMSKEDLKKLLDFYIKSNILLNKELNEKTFDQLVDEKYFISGNGNPRELLKCIALNPY
ncbi:mitochondrial 37S ribosomal protein mS29 Ecym_2189 [Eremothecium cymbalariae DBVPG|uniref:Small ribosomal subunit protein mS29 n=1 Tax=Eremothecium cymbalariae (strain CBS 270.75 / DBVPG 7215 / KCTC 17166 / NRRL Y-17582) TaxID=931890 RepID=G8JP33_ERECY|nr:Hypothetical protein Ecym_2189 [Eremothecium cymbalariae DBVPG\